MDISLKSHPSYGWMLVSRDENACWPLESGKIVGRPAPPFTLTLLAALVRGFNGDVAAAAPDRRGEAGAAGECGAGPTGRRHPPTLKMAAGTSRSTSLLAWQWPLPAITADDDSAAPSNSRDTTVRSMGAEATAAIPAPSPPSPKDTLKLSLLPA